MLHNKHVHVLIGAVQRGDSLGIGKELGGGDEKHVGGGGGVEVLGFHGFHNLGSRESVSRIESHRTERLAVEDEFGEVSLGIIYGGI